jgi:pimeloyl-ACP methyl ester carboxylesterase
MVAASSLGGQSPPGEGRSENVSLERPGVTLRGTLLAPPGPGPFPVVLIIAGSGPTDRDGNSALASGPNNSLRLLAEGLAAQGIASLRYDKRGVAESAMPRMREEEMTFDTLVEDAALWVRQLRADPRFSAVGVVGHSEGSLIGMIAARQAGARVFVSIAGPGRPAADLIRRQMAGRLPPSLQGAAERAFQSLTAGRTVDSIPPELAPILRSSVQPYLIAWFRYDPAVELASLQVPVLIAQGTTDVQVLVEDAQLLARASPRARLLIVEGMNHVLKLVPADQAAQVRSYSDPSLPVAPALVSAIVELVRVAGSG